MPNYSFPADCLRRAAWLAPDPIFQCLSQPGTILPQSQPGNSFTWRTPDSKQVPCSPSQPGTLRNGRVLAACATQHLSMMCAWCQLNISFLLLSHFLVSFYPHPGRVLPSWSLGLLLHYHYRKVKRDLVWTFVLISGVCPILGAPEVGRIVQGSSFGLPLD